MLSSTTLTVLEVAEPHCATEVMSDEVVALNVETGIYFSMRELGAALWSDLAAGHPVEDLASQMRAAHGSDAALVEFVSQVREHGLMRATDARLEPGDSAVSAALRSGRDQLVFEVFEDMKDLILSDPVHDVDETRGWPNPRDHPA